MLGGLITTKHFITVIGIAGVWTALDHYLQWLQFQKSYEEELKELDYKYIDLSPYNVLLGHDENLNPIHVNMKKCTHIIITGLSGTGKTGMLRTIISNLNNNADVVLCNAFKEDFQGIEIKRFIRGPKDTTIFLKNIYENLYKRDRPLYIIIEELATLRDATTLKIIYELLCVARHYNIFLIALVQEALKENIKAKSLFNCRVAFRCVDDSGFKSALGTDFKENLKHREFILRSNEGFIKGKTYTFKDFEA